MSPAWIKDNRGVALILAVVFVVLLTVITFEYVYETNVDAALVENYNAELEAYIAARSAIANGFALLEADLLDDMEGGGVYYDSLEDSWAYGVPYEALNDAVMLCGIDDEYGKIPLNALLSPDGEEENLLVAEALRALFRMRGAEEDPVDNILDWMDPTGEGRFGGTGDQYYTGLEVPYGAKRAPMDSVEELLLVRGVTPEVYFGDPEAEQRPLHELVTVRGDPNGRININTARFEALEAFGEALDGELAMADVVIRERENQPFQDEEDAQNRGVYAPRQQPEDGAVTPITVRSNVFRLTGDGIAGNVAVRIETHVFRGQQGGPGNLRVLDWRVIR